MLSCCKDAGGMFHSDNNMDNFLMAERLVLHCGEKFLDSTTFGLLIACPVT